MHPFGWSVSYAQYQEIQKEDHSFKIKIVNEAITYLFQKQDIEDITLNRLEYLQLFLTQWLDTKRPSLIRIKYAVAIQQEIDRLTRLLNE